MKRKIIIFSILLLICVIYLYTGNTLIVSTEYEIYSSGISENFSGFTIVHISDLHNASFGKNQEQLIKKINKAEPDIIVITGDLIDSRRKGTDNVKKLLENLPEQIDVYFVTGNHEAASKEYNELLKILEDNNVNIMQNENTLIERDGQYINLCGINDPLFLTGTSYSKENDERVAEILGELCTDDFYNILLSHHPEMLDIYAQSAADLVLSGHAHGGQIRLPFIGGLFAPGQGLLPEYTDGIFTQDNTNLIVSRGLGNSVFPLRVNNFPELVTIKLYCR